ncbi:sugar phosphate isomerase/epimerase [Candidatus Woesearchaeota archaeon]|nr:sugar phosphate isomerase/epimerase [Candidatus Woesearchaeota archaeon]
MVEFQTDYYTPMDREYEVGIASGVGKQTKIEEPIVSIGELGQTVPEIDPAGKFKNMVQGVQAAMRAGSKNIQLVMSTPVTSPMGGRPKAYGQEVRQAMKDAFLANDARLIGIELPSSMNNLSGFDQQQGVFSETTRQKHMDEVKEAIRFASDVGQGGGIDVVSWEFQRPISNIAPESEGFQPEEEEVLQVVDSKTGRINAFRKKEVRIHLPFEPGTETPITKETERGLPKLEPWEWEDFVNLAKQKGTKPEKEFIEMQLNAQIDTSEGWAGHYVAVAAHAKKRVDEAKEAGEPQEVIDKLEREYNYDKQLAQGQAQQAEELRERKNRMMPVSEYAKQKAIESYADLGIDAMDETNNNPKVRHPIHVGPEIGWPHAYGGHPKEFVELIQESRKRMVEKLVHDPNRKMSLSQAKKEAHEHIQGMFDTGHLGMWLEHFKPRTRYQERLKEFNKWFMKQVDMIADADVVGGIQAVDSAGAAHGHLPAGQGIFPVVEAVKTLKQKGFKGYIVSEGHEEERFGEGRILLKTWQAFNAPIESKYGPGVPARQFNDIHQGYFGRTKAPTQMFGSYTPPFGEYKPWSEIPFE